MQDRKSNALSMRAPLLFFWANKKRLGARLFNALVFVIGGSAYPIYALQLGSAKVHSEDFLSKVYTIDGIFKSMMGPQSTVEIQLLSDEDPQVVWITGYRAVIVDKDGSNRMSQEYMCHSNLDIDMRQHRRFFSWKKNAPRRLFTLSQGQFDIKFPEGFGIPVYTGIPMRLSTQVLNLNEQEHNKTVRHKVTIDFVKETELKTPMKALFMKAANGLVLLDGKDGYYDVEKPDAVIHGTGCMVGEKTVKGRILEDRFGRKFSGHWVVPPGRHVYRTLVTSWMQLPYDTTIHYIAAHLHPFAESLELYDLTAKQSVFKNKVDNHLDRIGIDRVDYYSGAEGIAVFKNHQYELISVYNNTSKEVRDAMAVMFLYVLDRDYKRPEQGNGQSMILSRTWRKAVNSLERTR